MEHHGKNPQQIVFVIIPARYGSTRLEGKLLLEIAGKPLILHTLGQAKKAQGVTRVIVATDNDKIYRRVTEGGGEAFMTSGDHCSGSDRVAEVARGLPAGSIIVNVQGDEPMIPPGSIEKSVAALMDDPKADIATTSGPIESREVLLDPNVVKVVTSNDGYALYFSRSPVPFPREASLKYMGGVGEAVCMEPDLLNIFRRHTGLYAYRREYLLEFTKLPPSRLEKIEMLEQLRALESGARIRVVEVDEASIGVDTVEDFEIVKRMIEDNG